MIDEKKTDEPAPKTDEDAAQEQHEKDVSDWEKGKIPARQPQRSAGQCCGLWN